MDENQLVLDLGLTAPLEDLPKGADKELAAEAILNSVDVFLTLDKRLIRASSRMALPQPKVMSPEGLIKSLDETDVRARFGGGLLDHANCPYGHLVAGDIGKWSKLFAVGDLDGDLANDQ